MFFVRAFDVESDAVIDDLVDQVAEAVRHKEQARLRGRCEEYMRGS